MKTLIILALLLLPVVVFAESEKPQEKQQVCSERIVVARKDGIGQCVGDCSSEQGMCISYCNGNPSCIARCADAHGRCVARCHR